MRIAISGTHFIGKSTLIEDFMKKHPQYRCELEPYYKLQDEKTMELSLEPSLESCLEQLDYSIQQLNECAHEQNVIFDRCAVDFLAYAMCALEQDDIDIHDSELSERFPDMKEDLNHLDLIVFLPISHENFIDYTEDNPSYRIAADKNLGAVPLKRRNYFTGMQNASFHAFYKFTKMRSLSHNTAHHFRKKSDMLFF